MILGGDYSHWDAVLDWPNHDWKYAFIKVSEGTVEDSVFKEQWKAAHDRVYRGGYHFFRPLVPWKSAAEKFMQLMDREGLGELPPVLDLEATNGVSNNGICTSALEWLRYVHRESGQRPLVYTGPGFADSIRLWRYIEFSDYPLWQATYPWDTISNTWSEAQREQRLGEIVHGDYAVHFPVAARPWQDVGRSATFWQFTGACPPIFVPGYPLGNKKEVDVNLYRGTLQDLIFQFNLPEPVSYTHLTLPTILLV